MIPWDDVSLDKGTGIVHIAPGCGAEDFELSKVHDLAVLTPVDEAGRFYPDYGWLHGLSTVEAAEQIVGDLGERGLLVAPETNEHRYPFCWRCHTPLIFRLSDDWFIAVDELRQPLLDANATVEWTPAYMGKRMDDWLRNMGDWNISRRRYYGLPLPFYPCACGHLNVIGSRAELEERALGGLDQLEELRRPWIDAVPIRCEACGEPVQRIEEVGDVWLDAGIVPFSTLGWQNPEYVPEGYATGAAKGLTTADLPDHAYWEQWFPADWVSEMREQIRLWFYSQLFMSVALTGRAPFTQGARLREDARRARPRDARLVGQHDRRRGRVRAHGRRRDALAVLRAAARPQPPLRLRAGAGDQAPAADALELGDVPRRLRRRSSRSGPPTPTSSAAGPMPTLQPLDRWLVARTAQLVAEATGRLRALAHGRRDARLRRVRRRPLELVHPPLAAALLGRRRDGAAHALVRRSSQGLRVIAPVMPFLAEHLWQALVADVADDAPASVFLAGWPEARAARRRRCSPRWRELRRVVALGHQARSAAGLKLRQPLRRIVVEGAPLAAAHADEIAEELRVKEVEFGHVDARAAGQAAPARARAEARQGARRGAGRARRRASSRSSAAAGSGRPGTSSARTRCSSSGPARRAGRSPATTASRSRSTPRSTTSSRSRAASTS